MSWFSILCRACFRGGECLNEDGGLGCHMGSTLLYGEGKGPIWIDDLKCEGLETNIDECMKSNWGSTNCQHKEDVSCICRPKNDGSAVRLVGGTSRMEGLVEIYWNSSWGSVCDDEASRLACRVVCKQLKFKSVNALSFLKLSVDSVQTVA